MTQPVVAGPGATSAWRALAAVVLAEDVIHDNVVRASRLSAACGAWLDVPVLRRLLARADKLVEQPSPPRGRVTHDVRLSKCLRMPLTRGGPEWSQVTVHADAEIRTATL